MNRLHGKIRTILDIKESDYYTWLSSMIHLISWKGWEKFLGSAARFLYGELIDYPWNLGEDIGSQVDLNYIAGCRLCSQGRDAVSLSDVVWWRPPLSQPEKYNSRKCFRKCKLWVQSMALWQRLVWGFVVFNYLWMDNNELLILLFIMILRKVHKGREEKRR